MQKITPFLWFEKHAEEAANFYVDTFKKHFKDSKVGNVNYYTKEGAAVSGQTEGSAMVVEFTLAGQEFSAINGGPMFKMSGAISFIINCETQEQVDYFWDKLSSDGGEAGQCGWINHDKYGITWQVTPTILGKLMSDPDPVKSGRVMAAMLQMTKIDIAKLEKAYGGK